MYIKLFDKFLKKVYTISIFILFNITIINNIYSTNNIITIQQEFKNFIKKYNGNSCIMEIFHSFQNKCEEINDDLNALLSFRMTKCVYQNLKKEININCTTELECIKSFEGDLWTTYISFSHHIDNLCFYYKTIIWEKSSEFLFFKLVNSSSAVLSELGLSYNLAEKMIKTQQSFSIQIEQHLLETLDNFKIINNFMDNYTKIEEKLKEDMNTLDMKISDNNEKISNVIKSVDEKIEYLKIIYEFFYLSDNNSNSFCFYFLFLFFTLVLTTFKPIRGIRHYLHLFIVLFFLFEKFLLNKILSPTFYQGGIIYYTIVLYLLRICYVSFILILIIIRCIYFEKKVDSTTRLLSEYNKYINMTPVWLRKYFNRLEMQNESLLNKYRKMKELIEKEK